VKGPNCARHRASPFSMGDESEATTGEVVYLLAELRSEKQGPVHEIGSRARVLGADGDRLTLAVCRGSAEEVVTCPRGFVARRPRSLASRRHFVRADVTPAT
jgi:hypothetical protein